jgi:hypothetical protein
MLPDQSPRHLPALGREPLAVTDQRLLRSAGVAVIAEVAVEPTVLGEAQRESVSQAVTPVCYSLPARDP